MKNILNKFLPLFVLIQLSFTAVAQQVELITETTQKTAYENKNYLIVKSLTLKPGFIFNGTQGSFYAKVHPNATVPSTPSNDQNFVRTESILVEGMTSEDQVRSLNNLDKSVTFTYSDGAGKPLQSISVASSPSLNDVIQPAYYDALGRPERSYAPYTIGATGGAFQNNALAQQEAFYSNTNDKVADEFTRPYSAVVYDPAPGVSEVKNIGAAYANKSTFARVRLNDAGVVREWTINANGLPVSNNTYAAGMLAYQETEDTENFKTRSYSDWLGRTVMTESETTENRWAITYYVYNEYGNVLYVIPPAAATNYTPDQAYADRWYFQNRYDDQQRKIASKTPGAGWVYTAYDQWDRVVLTQDANQRSKSPREWSFVKYDAFNRPIVTGIYKTNETNEANVRSAVAAAAGRYETTNETAVGYTLTSTFPSATEADLLSITYYDDYSFLNNNQWDPQSNNYNFVNEVGFTGTARDGVNDKVLDLATGGKIRVLDSDIGWLNSVTWYDDELRPLQTIGKNIFNNTDRFTSEYANWTGEVLKTKHVHTKGANSTSILERFEYDPTGRLLKSYHKIDSQPEVLLTAFEYNELGQVVKKELHTTSPPGGGQEGALQAIDYRYNIQGSLTNINYTNPEAGDPVDYFSMELAYYNSLNTGNFEKFDGSITGIKWKHDLSNKDRVYNYTYDKKSLTQGAYKTLMASADTEVNAYTEEGIKYDLNGNIKEMDRYAWKTTNAQKIDDLSYNYGASEGNQLMKVDELQAGGAGVDGFTDGNTSGDDYVYDVNGNLIEDKNKGITITYNVLDLPKRITLSDNSYIQYTYDAGGAKLKEVYYNVSHEEQYRREYVGGFVYYGEGSSGNTEPVLLHHSQGRLVPASFTNLITNTAIREANTTAGFSANGNVTITQENLNNETYIKVVSNQSSSTPGVYPIGGTISVKPGESYSLKVLGYQSVGSTAALYVKNVNGGDILWPGATLPIGSGAETLATSTFTIPAGVTQIAVGVLWNGVSSGHTFYINRIALYKTDWEYQYFLNDHLGSTRVVLQTTPHTFTYVATMESANHAQENTQFFNLSSVNEIPSPGNATPGGSKAYLMNANNKTGPARSFRVLPGDVIDASVMAWYPGGGTYAKNSLTTMGAAVASVLGGGTTVIIDGINGSYASSAGNPNFLLSPDQGSGKPSAFLNYILFNEHYQPIEAKSQPVGNTANALHAVVLPSISIKETGYLFIYLSFDNTAGEVHFDELKITYQESPIVQINAYYPYGMTALNWTRDGELDNRYNFQGKEYENKTEWHNFHARQYDATLGRWFATDPANQFSSPYLAMGNNPIIGIDPDGQWVNFVVGAVVGGIGGFVTGKALGKSGWDLFAYTIAGAGIGAATAGIGTAVTAGTTTTFGAAGSTLVGGTVAGSINGAAMAGLGGGDIGQGALYGAIGGLAGSTASLANVQGVVPGALYGAGTGGLISGGISSLSGGSFGDGFRSGAISGGILGGIGGGINASQSKYERNILFGNATKAGKQAFVNDLVRGLDLAGGVMSATLTDEFNGTTTNAQTRPIIDGRERTLEYAMTNNPEGTKSNIYLKYRGRSLRALASTFRHEMVHANDYFYGDVGNFYNSQTSYSPWKTKVWAEIRGYRANIQFGYRKSMYTTELNRYLNAWQTRVGTPFPY
ncbi:hypothetical protein SanaruYs_06580 [Chryseotalea sanaruensis]|uniref:DUF6443 domain-containing protein n=1 Tax=Chryseotalea sanaruensis TaxID=2482724 RepID=A0A401U6A4_9BACT|nr:RHS repeat-associated core domain-containing protein [Chryseotalea sanaruensis]GCC50443.1 hypothetical protein SanaruYs_06580 [Chryseotalea sanaruensis]